MLNPNKSYSKISGYLYFLIGLILGVTISLYLVEETDTTYEEIESNSIEKINSSRLTLKTRHKLNEYESSVIDDHDYAISEKIRVVCMVMTNHIFHQTRVVAVQETWGRHCDILIFMSDIEDPSIPTIGTNDDGNNDQRGKWKNIVNAYLHIQKYYAGKFDWVIKADDDTYVYIETLKKYLVNYSPNDEAYFGFYLKSPTKYMSGGAGCVISTETLRLLLEEGLNKTMQYNKCTKSMDEFEDVVMGDCMKQLKVPFGNLRDSLGRERFFTESVDSHTYPYNDMTHPIWNWYKKASYYPTHYGLNCCSEEPITFHHINYKAMYMMEYMIYYMKQPKPQILQHGTKNKQESGM